MNITNTDEEYGLVHKAFHWLIAVIIIGLLPVGLFMVGMENSPLKLEIYAMHKSFGLLVLALGILRLLWRFFSPVPDELETHKTWEVALAGGAHFWLYVCIIGMPLSGWLMSSASQFPVPFFGWQLPHIIGKNEKLGEIFANIHEILAYTLLFILALHAAGALKHHLIDKDETLQRMSWKKAGYGLAAMIVVVVGASYLASSYGLWRDFKAAKAEAPVAAAAAVTPTPVRTETVDLSFLGEHGWAIVPAESKLTFRTTLYGSEFEGVFGDFNGTIVFNPDDLANASADIRIGMKNVATGDADRDSNIQNSDWFDSENNPESRFKTIHFESLGDGKYIAVGDLTLRGVTLPVSLPFILDIQGNRAVMTGEVTLSRLDFGIGTGEWGDDKIVGRNVVVKIALIAIR